MGIVSNLFKNLFGTPEVAPPPPPMAMPASIADPSVYAGMRARKRFGSQSQMPTPLAKPTTAETTLLGG